MQKVSKKPMNSINMIRIRYRTKTIELKLGKKKLSSVMVSILQAQQKDTNTRQISNQSTQRRVNILKIQLHPKNKQKNKSLSNLKHHVNKVT